MELTKVVCAIIANKGKLLICKRSVQMSNPEKWEFPGGKIHQGESAEEAIKRECQEELDIHVGIIKTGSPIIHKYPHIRIQLIPIYCNIESGTIKLAEHENFRYVHPNMLVSYNLSEADKILLEHNKGFNTLVCGC